MVSTNIIKINPKRISLRRIRQTAKILKQGGLVAFPTDTVYGLGANCYNKKAVARLYEIKKRPKTKPFPIQIKDPRELKNFNVVVPEDAKTLIDKYWPGPLTIILESKNKEKIGFRIPDNKITQGILEEIKDPLCVPSANFSGEEASKEIKSVIISFDGIIEAIVDGGSCRHGVESTVIDLTRAPYRILREGAVKQKELNKSLGDEKFIKVKYILFVCTGNSCRSVMAKGLLKKEKKSSFDLNVISAGTAVFAGMSPTKETIEVMHKEDIDVANEKSKGVSKSLIQRADLILTMEPQHRQFLIGKFPESKDKVFLLKEYKNRNKVKNSSIKDPIGQSIDVYREVLEEIKKEIKRIKDLI